MAEAAIPRHNERRTRDAHGQFLIEGLRFVLTALRTGAEILAIAVTRERARSALARQCVAAAEARGATVVALTEDELRQLSLLDEPAGIAAVVAQRPARLTPHAARGRPLWLAFEQVRSPGNLGTIVRTAHAAGARGVLLLGDSIDPYDPRVIRATMGSIFHQRLVRTTHDELDGWRRRARCPIVGTSAHAHDDYRRCRLHGRAVLMFGCERRGLSDAQQRLCDTFVRIPMAADIDSLNLAAAATLLLYEAYRQRHRL